MVGTYIEVRIIQYMKKTDRIVLSQFFRSRNFNRAQNGQLFRFMIRCN